MPRVFLSRQAQRTNKYSHIFNEQLWEFLPFHYRLPKPFLDVSSKSHDRVKLRFWTDSKLHFCAIFQRPTCTSAASSTNPREPFPTAGKRSAVLALLRSAPLSLRPAVTALSESSMAASASRVPKLTRPTASTVKWVITTAKTALGALGGTMFTFWVSRDCPFSMLSNPCLRLLP